MEPHEHWIVTADGRRVGLYSCRKTPGGELHVEQVRSMENTHEAEHERHRPSMLGGAERRGGVGHSGATAAPHSASFGHEEREEHQRFAREVGAWLSRATKDIDADCVSIFAPVRFLGLLRGEISAARRAGSAKQLTDLREGELTHLRPGELAVHPAVLNAIAERSRPALK